MQVDFHAADMHYSYAGRQADATWKYTMMALTNPYDKTIVDIGCGGGIYSEAFARMGAAQVVGIDSSAVMIDDARAMVEKNDKLSFIVADAENTTLPAAFADVVFTRAVIHHLKDLHLFLKEAFRVLKPGGTLVIQDRTKNDVSLPASVEHIRGYLFEAFPKLLPVDVSRRLESNEVEQGFVTAGFERILSTPLWETRRVYPTFEPLKEELLARTARSILHELTDDELRMYVGYLREKLTGMTPIVERDRWTLWTAVKPLFNSQTSQLPPVHIRPFEAVDQHAAKSLILNGLGEHFGYIDYTLNPDLDDIQDTYILRGHTFLIAEVSGQLVATGCLMFKGSEEGQLVRMSVKQSFRRLGIASRMARLLLAEARLRNLTSVYLKTIPTWQDAIGLYQKLGFVPEETQETIRMRYHIPY